MNLDDLIIYTNPSRRDVKNIYKDERYARGIILPTGDMLVWNGDIMHGKVMPFIKENGIHFSIFNDKLEICWQFESWKEIQRRLVLVKPYLMNLGFPEDGRIVFDTQYYTHTTLQFPEIRYFQLFDDHYEIKPIDAK
ncbi:hypothetical protein L1765_08160 [Microaerobacter geothermalis]|uniref:hypothetical protein n=1 Tax=Microaerobacter geothermalis TaxID=674972 RepID=UPI001F219691|nr:hypothetical protein [Microaerobacter geothermalis]MCF6093944.1 hypothetical protein [Microaerobacter geothermalis]